MSTESIIKAAVATVGIVQLIKNLADGKGNKMLWTILTMTVGFAMTAVQQLAPAWITDGIITVSGATLFYDTIYKTFENIFKKSVTDNGNQDQ